jgi:ClpP class serine protease
MSAARHRYDRQGLLALEPRAFFDLFFEPTSRDNEAAGDVAVVAIRGPLENHRGWWCDSYEEILERVDAACAGTAKAIVLRVDSPGGECAGMLDCARAIRARTAAAGKRLLAYVDGKACSAAYALACTAERIVVDDAALVGSIGVISARLDVTSQAAAMGVKVALVTSGARKADGHPHAPISEAELVETQTIVDTLAGAFFDHVSAMRGIDAATIAALEARTYAGADAVSVGLADAVGTFESVLALASTEPSAAIAAERSSTMDEARKALQAILDDENADEASKARAAKALAAMDDESDEKKDEEAKAEGDEGDEKKDEEAKASRPGSVSAKTAGEIGARAGDLEERLSAVERELEGERRKALLASRPDLPKTVAAVLATKPLAEVQEFVAAMPKAAPPKPAAGSTPTATRGETQGSGGASHLPPTEKQALDARMGLVATKPGIEERGNKLVLGATLPLTEKGA